MKEAQEMSQVLQITQPDRFAEELFYAIQRNDVEQTKLLLDYGAQPYRRVGGLPYKGEASTDPLDKNINYAISPLEGAFYSNFKHIMSFNFGESTYRGDLSRKYTLFDGKVEGRIEIMKLLGERGVSLQKQYDSQNPDDANDYSFGKVKRDGRYVVFHKELEEAYMTIPSKLLEAAAEYGVLPKEMLKICIHNHSL